jgi:5-oxoprolinase (ATP-hydrolysing) subunit A
MRAIDLNCDMGEMPEALADGSQETLMRFVSSANIACGGHAGNAEMMRETVEQALRCGVTIGAHPGYADPDNFGRRELQLSPEEISNSIHRQVIALNEVGERYGATIVHVKAHGALYNQAARSREIARAIADGVRHWRGDVVMVGLTGSVMINEFRAAGFVAAAEAFADRRYEGDGCLRSRKFADALLQDPKEAAEQALRIVTERIVIATDGSRIPVEADTICIHSDTPGAAEIAAAVRGLLNEKGIEVKPLGIRRLSRNEKPES